MSRWVQISPRRSAVLRALQRLGGCCAAAALGVLGAAFILAGAQLVLAAPTAQVRMYPGETPCNTSLQACINGANPGDTILIQANTYITSLVLNKAVSLTGVASNTVILHALPGHSVLTVTGAAVNSSVVISGLTFTGGSATGPFGSGGGIFIMPGAQPRLDSIRVMSNEAAYIGGGIYGLAVTLRNSVVQSNTAMAGGGGVAGFDSATIINSRLEGNACTTDGCLGGGLYAGAATVTGTSFVRNSAHYQGGGLLATTAVTLSGGHFQQNTCTQAGCVGGGLHTSGTLSLAGTAFFSNSAAVQGGGASAVGTTVATGGLFQGNACTQVACSGGALWSGQPALLSGTQAVSNTSAGRGGALAGQIAMTLTNVSIMSNTAATYGGGMYMLGVDPYAWITNSQFVGNRAGDGDGGAGGAFRTEATGSLFQNNACLGPDCGGGGLNAFVLVISDTDFIGNVAGEGGGSLAYSTQVFGGSYQDNTCTASACRGGGLYSNISLRVNGTTFLSNTAQGRGGGAYGEGSVYLTGGLFQGNRALEQHGGGVSSYNLEMSGTTFLSNTAALGGGAILARSTASLSGGWLQGNGCLEAGCLGGGLLAEAAIAVTGTQFLGNRAAGMGGGVAHLAGDGSVVNALYARNSAGTSGAALYLASGGAVNVYHATIASPTLGAGVAVDVVSGTVQVLNTVFANYGTGLRRLSAGNVFEAYNLFYAVAAPTVGVLVGGSGAHDVTGDPRFANPAADDYHLTAGSAALEVGADVAVTTDFEGDSRPFGNGFDIGYDEYAAEAADSRLFLPLVER